jgi:hypothetical protein
MRERRPAVFREDRMKKRSALVACSAYRFILVFVLAAALGGCAAAKAPVPKRWAYTVQPVAEWVTAEREEEMDFLIPAFDPLTAAGPADQIEARFRGKDRKGPKTSVADAPVEQFADLNALIATLPSDDDMRDHHQPPLETDSNTRVSEERRNVRVRAWIYAIKYEIDQDWHVILGTDPAQTAKTYFNAEVSGLPNKNAAAFPKLLQVRQSLAAILDEDLPGVGGYHSYADDPIPVMVEGSLFYDIDHAAGVVGPAGRRPKTAWEIHPITGLQLVQ